MSRAKNKKTGLYADPFATDVVQEVMDAFLASNKEDQCVNVIKSLNPVLQHWLITAASNLRLNNWTLLNS